MDILHYLNVLIGFSMVMLVLSVVTGSAAQAWLLFIRKQRIVVNEMLTNLLKEVDIKEENAKNLINEILDDRNPEYQTSHIPRFFSYIIDGISNLSKSGSNKYISREELLLYMLKKASKEAESKTLGSISLSQDIYKIEKGNEAEDPANVKSSFIVANEMISDILNNIQKEILTQELNNPKDPSFIWRTRAISKFAPNLASKIFTKFDELMDRSDDIVNRHGKVISTIYAFILIFIFWPVDSIQLVNKLNNDKVLTEKIANKIGDEYSNKFNEAWKQNPECLLSDIPKEKEDICKKHKETINALASSQLAELNKTLGLFVEKKVTCPTFGVDCVKDFAESRIAFGTLITFVFISMGSAFWLGILNKMLGIRSELGKKLEDERESRATSQQN